LNRGPKGGWFVYPVDGGPDREVHGIDSLEIPLGWRSDNRSIYVRPDRESSNSIPIWIVDTFTGKRSPWKVIHPSQTVLEIHDLEINPEGNAYAYSFVVIQSDLYIGHGLR
jgi:hypothetical protein